MKKITVSMLIALAAFSVYAQDVTIDNDLSAGWTRSRLASAANDTNVKVSSKHSVCLTNDTAKHNGFQKIVKLEPDTQYELTFMVKGENIEAGKGKGAGIVLGGNGKYSRFTSNADNSLETGTFDWRKVSGIFSTSRFKTGDIAMVLSINTKGKVWFDKIEFKKLSEVDIAARKIAQANDLSMTKGFKGWSRSMYAKPVADTQIKVSAECSAKLTNNAPDKSCAIYRVMKLEPDTPYELTFYMKGENIEASGNNGARIMLSANNRYKRATTQAGHAPETGTFDWRNGSYRFNTSEFKTGDVTISLMFSGTGTVWFDKIEVKKLSK